MKIVLMAVGLEGMRRLHRASALLIGMFILLHLANHIAAFWGPAEHIGTMQRLRTLYRSPVVEPVLLGAVVWQMGTGWLLILRRPWRTRRRVERLQVLSGAGLSLFLMLHVSAVLFGRMRGLDTNFYFAAAGFHFGRYWLFFAPYYLAAVLLIHLHVGCALYWRVGVRWRGAALTIAASAGAVLSAGLVAALAGFLYPVDVPVRYRAILPGAG